MAGTVFFFGLGIYFFGSVHREAIYLNLSF
jgi:hypothetical protein